MLKIIPIHSPLRPVGGVLIKRKILERNFYIDRLEKQTQKRAKKIVREAEEEASSLRIYAYQDGYEQGVIYALEQVTSYLSDNQELVWRLFEKVQHYARDMFSSAIDHPETLLTVLDEWLRDFDKPQTQLFLRLPFRIKKEHSKIMALLMENWSGTFYIEYHKEQRFIMQCGEQIAEFSPEQFVENAVGSLKHYLGDLPHECHTISDLAIDSFLEKLKSNNRI